LIKGVLVVFHCAESTGYAISSLEDVFLKVAQNLSPGNVHFSFKKLQTAPADSRKHRDFGVLCFDPYSESNLEIKKLSEYVKKNEIDLVLGFDQPPGRKYYRHLRSAGVNKIISYWGAPMSGINSGLKLFLKKMEMLLRVYSPDLYLFESNAMRETAVYGRGINKSKTAVTYLGVDSEKFKPNIERRSYVYNVFGIPKNRHIVYYSGHMEKRKGIATIMHAARHIIDERRCNDIHFLLLGNKGGESNEYLKILRTSKALSHVTFGGYRDDVEKILSGCSIGVIASTGWDSFTMSSLEMASSGLPLVVSNLQGLSETVDHGVTGFVFKPGDHYELADKIIYLLGNPQILKEFSVKSRARILNKFTKEHQIFSIYGAISSVLD